MISEARPVEYAVEPALDAAAFVSLLEASGLGQRRPIGDRRRIQRMLREASLIVTARFHGQLVGVARSMTDHSFCIYLSDLAVDKAWQGHGIGRELIQRTHELGGGDATTLILLSAPEAESYYPHVGLQQFPQCFIVSRKI